MQFVKSVIIIVVVPQEHINRDVIKSSIIYISETCHKNYRKLLKQIDNFVD